MPKYLSNFCHGRALVEHPGRQAVPEEVGSTAARWVYSGLGKCSPYNMADSGRTCQTNARRDDPQENASRYVLTPIRSQIECQCLSHFRKQRQLVQYPTLAPHAQLCGAPADVIELEGDNLSRTQTESRQEKQDCMVSASTGGRWVSSHERSFHIL
jgi:hypothetical protein